MEGDVTALPGRKDRQGGRRRSGSLTTPHLRSGNRRVSRRSRIVSNEVIAFPSSRRRAQVLQAVKMLNETHGEAANEAWRSLMRALADQLTAMGISAGEMRRQVLEFQAAVQLELQAQAASA